MMSFASLILIAMKRGWCAALAGLLCALLFAAEGRARQPASITYDHDCFIIGGVDTALYSGDVQYFRCPRGEWDDVLAKVKAAGCNTVQFYVPWNYHEKEYGRPDFSDLEEFLARCDRMGFYVIVRIGPYIDGEWDNGGFPSWLIGKVPARSYRSADPEYTRYVMHWYDEVLGVIRPRTIEHGGPVILLQIENEYGAATEEKKAALKGLYAGVIKNGVNVPIIACNTPNAWDKTDPVMAKIISGNNCHIVRFGSISRVETKLAETRAREPHAPAIMLEMPAGEGRYSAWSGLDYDEAVDLALTPLDYALVNKTAWMMGAGLTTYYAMYGGTSFGYTAASFGSTSYCGRPPVQCPLLEGGGIWDAYYEVKLIGQFLQTFGAQVVRARDPLDAYANRLLPFHYGAGHWVHVRDGAPWPMIREKVVDRSGFLFVRDDHDRPRELRLAYTDPIGGREVRIPAEGFLTLPAKEMLILPLNVDVGGHLMVNTTSQILGIDKVGAKTVIVAYGPPGTGGEMAFRLADEPAVHGPAAHTWNATSKTLRFNYTYADRDQYLGFDNVEIVVITKQRAYRTWDLAAGGDRLKVVSDAYFVQPAAANTGNGVSFEAQTRPGPARFSLVLPRAPCTVRINGAVTPFEWDSASSSLRFELSTGAMPARVHQTGGIRFRRDDLVAGDWQPAELRPLEEMGMPDGGYVRYRTRFTAHADVRELSIRLFDGSVWRNALEVGDPLLVFLNGRFVPELSGWPKRALKFDPTNYLQPGDNTLLICFEKISRPVGNAMGKQKGVSAVMVKRGDGAEQKLTQWEFIRGLDGQNRGYPRADFDDRSWSGVPTGEPASPGVSWHRLAFSVDQNPRIAGPLALHLKSAGDALIYLNGKLVGRRMREDWQTEFYLPDDYLKAGRQNHIAIAVRHYGDTEGKFEASVGTSAPFAVVRNDVTIEYR